MPHQSPGECAYRSLIYFVYLSSVLYLSSVYSRPNPQVHLPFRLPGFLAPALTPIQHLSVPVGLHPSQHAINSGLEFGRQHQRILLPHLYRVDTDAQSQGQKQYSNQRSDSQTSAQSVNQPFIIAMSHPIYPINPLPPNEAPIRHSNQNHQHNFPNMIPEPKHHQQHPPEQNSAAISHLDSVKQRLHDDILFRSQEPEHLGHHHYNTQPNQQNQQIEFEQPMISSSQHFEQRFPTRNQFYQGPNFETPKVHLIEMTKAKQLEQPKVKQFLQSLFPKFDQTQSQSKENSHVHQTTSPAQTQSHDHHFQLPKMDHFEEPLAPLHMSLQPKMKQILPFENPYFSHTPPQPQTSKTTPPSLLVYSKSPLTPNSQFLITVKQQNSPHIIFPTNEEMHMNIYPTQSTLVPNPAIPTHPIITISENAVSQIPSTTTSFPVPQILSASSTAIPEKIHNLMQEVAIPTVNQDQYMAATLQIPRSKLKKEHFHFLAEKINVSNLFTTPKPDLIVNPPESVKEAEPITTQPSLLEQSSTNNPLEITQQLNTSISENQSPDAEIVVVLRSRLDTQPLGKPGKQLNVDLPVPKEEDFEDYDELNDTRNSTTTKINSTVNDSSHVKDNEVLPAVSTSILPELEITTARISFPILRSKPKELEGSTNIASTNENIPTGIGTLVEHQETKTNATVSPEIITAQVVSTPDVTEAIGTSGNATGNTPEPELSSAQPEIHSFPDTNVSEPALTSSTESVLIAHAENTSGHTIPNNTNTAPEIINQTAPPLAVESSTSQTPATITGSADSKLPDNSVESGITREVISSSIASVLQEAGIEVITNPIPTSSAETFMSNNASNSELPPEASSSSSPTFARVDLIRELLSEFLSERVTTETSVTGINSAREPSNLNKASVLFTGKGPELIQKLLSDFMPRTTADFVETSYSTIETIVATSPAPTTSPTPAAAIRQGPGQELIKKMLADMTSTTMLTTFPQFANQNTKSAALNFSAILGTQSVQIDPLVLPGVDISLPIPTTTTTSASLTGKSTVENLKNMKDRNVSFLGSNEDGPDFDMLHILSIYPAPSNAPTVSPNSSVSGKEPIGNETAEQEGESAESPDFLALTPNATENISDKRTKMSEFEQLSTTASMLLKKSADTGDHENYLAPATVNQKSEPLTPSIVPIAPEGINKQTTLSPAPTPKTVPTGRAEIIFDDEIDQTDFADVPSLSSSIAPELVKIPIKHKPNKSSSLQENRHENESSKLSSTEVSNKILIGKPENKNHSEEKNVKINDFPKKQTLLETSKKISSDESASEMLQDISSSVEIPVDRSSDYLLDYEDNLSAGSLSKTTPSSVLQNITKALEESSLVPFVPITADIPDGYDDLPPIPGSYEYDSNENSPAGTPIENLGRPPPPLLPSEADYDGEQESSFGPASNESISIPPNKFEAKSIILSPEPRATTQASVLVQDLPIRVPTTVPTTTKLPIRTMKPIFALHTTTTATPPIDETPDTLAPAPSTTALSPKNEISSSRTPVQRVMKEMSIVHKTGPSYSSMTMEIVRPVKPSKQPFPNNEEWLREVALKALDRGISFQQVFSINIGNLLLRRTSLGPSESDFNHTTPFIPTSEIEGITESATPKSNLTSVPPTIPKQNTESNLGQISSTKFPPITPMPTTSVPVVIGNVQEIFVTNIPIKLTPPEYVAPTVSFEYAEPLPSKDLGHSSGTRSPIELPSAISPEEEEYFDNVPITRLARNNSPGYTKRIKIRKGRSRISYANIFRNKYPTSTQME